MKKQMKIIYKRVVGGILAVLYFFTVLGNIECKAIGNIEDRKTETYLIYGIDANNNDTGEASGITSEILKENDMEVMELSNSEKIKIKQRGYYIEKDIQLNASAENQLELEDSYEQWNLDAIHLPNEISKSRDKVKIAILDSGVSYSEDISIVERKCFIEGEEEMSSLWEDVTGHGTAIAGLIAAEKNNIGITGVIQNAEVYSLRVLDENNKTTVSRVVAAIYWAIEHDINILNMSFGTISDSKLLHKAIKAANKAGILMIAAGGNDKGEDIQYPAAYPEVIAVGASDCNGNLVGEFSKGTELELVAPGKMVLSSGLLDGIAGTSGTSIAAAQVTGAAGIIWQMDISKTADFVRQLLVYSARKLNNGSEYGAGLIDIESAIENYKLFESQYAFGEQEYEALNLQEAEEFYNVETMEALWTKDGHENIIIGYINPRVNISETDLQIMVHTARGADNDTYHNDSSCLHGTGNYVKGLKYLYLLAQYVRQGYSNENASNLAYQAIPAGGNTMVSELKRLTEIMLKNGGSGNNERYYRVMGFALHCIGDTFAHRPYVYELTGFNSSDFKNYSAFVNAVNNNLEYRYIKQYTDVALSKYEDNPNIGEYRYKNAKLKCLQFFNASQDGNGYTSRFFENLTYPLVLDDLNVYVQSY